MSEDALRVPTAFDQCEMFREAFRFAFDEENCKPSAIQARVLRAKLCRGDMFMRAMKLKAGWSSNGSLSKAFGDIESAQLAGELG
ncbi:MAG TPA: hypothetical protein VIS99_17490 [Terrimicrobiaceae bacterium]